MSHESTCCLQHKHPASDDTSSAAVLTDHQLQESSQQEHLITVRDGDAAVFGALMYDQFLKLQSFRVVFRCCWFPPCSWAEDWCKSGLPLAINTSGRRPPHLLLPPKSNLPFKCSDNQEKPQRLALPILYPALAPPAPHTHTSQQCSAPSEVAAVFVLGEKHLTK